jgi:DNA polymerase I-like protein with 3'-5' exonuclease and polymerase domains
MWDNEKFVAFDFETSGVLPEYALQPWRVAQGKAWATSIAIVGKTGDKFTISGGLSPKVEDMRAFLESAISKNQTIVGWNTVFDIQWLLAYGLEDLVMKAKWLDGMLLWRHYFIEPEYDADAHKRKSYSLKACVREYLPEHAGYEEDIDFHSLDVEVLYKLHAYNIKDTQFTFILAKHWYNQLAQNPQQLKAALIEAESLPLVAKANLQGMVVDTLAANELRQGLTDQATKYLQELAPFGVTETVVRSPTKLAKLLFDDWGLTPIKENVGKKTGRKTRATDKETLHELSFVDARAKTLRSYREALNNKTKFADAPLASVRYNGSGCSHPQAIVFGTYSGRLTYASKQGKNKDERQTGFALHQEKRGSEFRSIIVPPEGYTLMEFDASGQEFRWMAIASNDPVMLDLCGPGKDPHSFMGARIDRVPYDEHIRQLEAKETAAKDRRQLGKVANLSLQYRTSARKLRSVARVQYSMPMELGQAQLIYETYQQTYSRVPRYWDSQIDLTKRRGYVETFAGRRVQVVGNWEGKNSWSMGSTAINYRIQGTGADQKYLALAVLRPYLTRIGAYFAWDLHDGIYLYVPDDKVVKAVSDIKYLLANLPYQRAWGFEPPIALPWDCKVGKSWGALREWKD